MLKLLILRGKNLKCGLSQPFLSKCPFTGRKIESIIRPELKDFTKNQLVDLGLKQQRNQYIQEEVAAPLSAFFKGERKKSEGKIFAPNKEKLNRAIRTDLKKKIDIAKEKAKIEEVPNDMFEDQLSANIENKRLAAEYEVFKKNYFVIKETQRLLKKQERSAENFLPEEKIIDSTALNLARRFKDYKASVSELKNKRIEGFLTGSENNKKLGILIQSGLLNNSENVRSIINKANQLSQEEKIGGGILISEKNGNAHSIGEGQLQELQKGSDLVPLDKKQKDAFYMKLIESLNLNVTLEDLQKVDFEELKNFFEEFLSASKEDKKKLQESMLLVEKMRSYETFLFDKYRNNDINLRTKGKLEFKHLTETECLNFLKYNINNDLDLLRMYDNSKEVHSPRLISSFVQKISLINLRESHSILHVIKDNRYRALLRSLSGVVNMLTNREFVDTVWSLGRIHKEEMGLIYPRLFETLLGKLEVEIQERLAFFNCDELSFMLRGVLRVPKINDKEDLQKIILEVIEKKKAEVNDAFTLNGMILYLSHHAIYNDEARRILFSFLEVLEKPSIIDSMDKDFFMDVIYSYSSLLIRNNEEDGTKALNHYIEKIKVNVVEYVKEMPTNELGSLSIFLTKLNNTDAELFKPIKNKFIYNLRDYDQVFEKSLSMTVYSLAHFDLAKSIKVSPENSLHDSEALLALFPIKIFNPKSVQYLPYSELAHFLRKYKHHLKPSKNLISILNCLISVNYRNIGFYQEFVELILTKGGDLLKNPETHGCLISIYKVLRSPDRYFSKIISLTLEGLDFGGANGIARGRKTVHSLIKVLQVLANFSEKSYNKEIENSGVFNDIIAQLPVLSTDGVVGLMWSLVSLDFLKKNESNEIFELLVKILEARDNDHNKYPQRVYLLNQINLYCKFFLSREISCIDSGDKSKIIKNFYNNHIEPLLEEVELISGQRSPMNSYMREIESLLKQEKIEFEKDKIINDMFPISFYLPKTNQAIRLLAIEVSLEESFGRLLGIFELENRLMREMLGLDLILIRTSDLQKAGQNAENIDKMVEQRNQYVLEKIYKQTIKQRG